MRLMLSMSFKTQLLLISKYNQYIAICIIYFPLMNLKNNIKSKQMQTVRHNPDKDSCSNLKRKQDTVTKVPSYRELMEVAAENALTKSNNISNQVFREIYVWQDSQIHIHKVLFFRSL